MLNKIFNRLPYILGIGLVLVLIICVRNCQAKNVYQWVEYYSIKFEVDSRVIERIIEVESSGDSKGISHAGAVGLMGVMPQTGYNYCKYMYSKTESEKWLVLSKMPYKAMVQYLKITSVNVCIGSWCLKQEVVRCKGNYIKALNRYNRGNKSGVSWKYINDIMNGMSHFKE
jgi:soluble lytic murein transglycosylase-like protein